MNAIVLEHVPLSDLPQAWRDKLARELARGSNDADGLVTVRIEAEHAAGTGAAERADDPLFGMWQDRDDMSDVTGYIRRIRAPRFNGDAAHDEA